MLLGFSGCGPDNPDGRINVTGTILLNGKPFEGDGAVVFSPQSGETDAGGQAPILNGKFFCTKRSAPKPGKYIVRLFSVQEYDSGTNQPLRKLAAEGVRLEKGRKYLAKVIPDEFNVNSTIEFEVIKGKRNVFRYDIVTDYKPSFDEQ
jgi:hypothetical protein